MLFATNLTLQRYGKGKSLAFTTIQQYLSHVYELHLRLGHDQRYKDFFGLQRVMKGIKRVLGCENRNKRRWITLECLRRVYDKLDLTSYGDALVWPLFTILFFKCMRSGESAVPSRGYQGPKLLRNRSARLVVHCGEEFLSLTLAVSKLDPFRKGREVVTASRDDILCPVMAYKLLQTPKRQRGMEDAKSALFPWVNGRPVTYPEVNKLVKVMARVAGYEDWNDYSGHALRKGAATAYARAHVSERMIRRRGVWRGPTIPEKYIHVDLFDVAKIVRNLK